MRVRMSKTVCAVSGSCLSPEIPLARECLFLSAGAMKTLPSEAKFYSQFIGANWNGVVLSRRRIIVGPLLAIAEHPKCAKPGNGILNLLWT